MLHTIDSYDYDQTRAFKLAWDAMAKAAYNNAIEKGFWDNPRMDGESIALIHSELSEALEALRGDNSSAKTPYLLVEEELADVVIRLMDYAQSKGYDVAGALIAKMQYNRTRPRMHGKAF